MYETLQLELTMRGKKKLHEKARMAKCRKLDRVLIDTKMCRWTINRQGVTNDVSYSTLIFIHPRLHRQRVGYRPFPFTFPFEPCPELVVYFYIILI